MIISTYSMNKLETQSEQLIHCVAMNAHELNELIKSAVTSALN
jgi:hypothetical protein